MADTDVAPRTAGDDELPPGVLGTDLDLPWRLDVPALRQLRIVRRVPEIPTVPPPTAPARTPGERLGIGPRFRLATRTRLGVMAVCSAVLGLAASLNGAAGVVDAPANPVGEVKVLGAEAWQVAAPGTRDWVDGAIVLGRQDAATACAAGALPADRSAHRHSTATNAIGDQHVTRMGTVAAADRLVGRWLTNLRACQRETYGADGRTASIRTLGTYPNAGDGLVVVGVFYRLPDDGAFGRKVGTNLFAIGRDGRLVTTLQLAVAGGRGKAPIGEFTSVAKQALSRLR